jgi:hypothetical protein
MKYRGIVKFIDDPEKRGRIRVSCPSVLGSGISNWALPSFPPNTFDIPAIGSLVWIEFEDGNKESPIWTGVFYTTEQFKAKFGAVYDPKTSLKAVEGDLTLQAGKKVSVGSVNDFTVASSNTNLTTQNFNVNVSTMPITTSGTDKVTVNGKAVELKP